jgi:hypothetical protein
MATLIRGVRYRSGPPPFDYEFTFEYVGNGWRVWIDRHPPYTGRNDGSVTTHRLWAAGRAYICWDRPIATLKDAKQIAALWADATHRYLATGSFAPPPDRPDVTDLSPSANWAGAASPGDPEQRPALFEPPGPRVIGRRPPLLGLWRRRARLP